MTHGDVVLTTLPSPKSQLGICSRAMLLLGFGAALHNSELVGLGISDVARVVGRASPLAAFEDRSARPGPPRRDLCQPGSAPRPPTLSRQARSGEIYRPLAVRPVRDRHWGARRRPGRSDAADTA